MKHKIKIYIPFINAGIQETIAYRMNWIFNIFGSILGCFVSYYIWNAVFLSSKSNTINGFTMSHMVIYIFLMYLTGALINSGGTYDIGEEIRDGSISMRIIKPISYNTSFLFQEIGNKSMTVFTLILPMIIGLEIVRFYLTGILQFNVFNFLLYILSCVLAYLINFFFNICFGFIAFLLNIFGELI